MTDLPYAFGRPGARATLRATPDDFEVHELLDFEPDGDGDHVLLQIQKRNTNTEWLARQLAKFAQVKHVDVGYCGLKDRNGVTTQWFSINLIKKIEPDWKALESGDLRVLRAERHRRKLKRGAHSGNRFVITLRDVNGDAAEIESRVREATRNGVPNYFGEQRFGFDAGNVQKAREMFANEKIPPFEKGGVGGISAVAEENPPRSPFSKGGGNDRHTRGLYLSAARSYLFNLVLAQRVSNGTWNRPFPGDAFILNGTNSFFVMDDIDAVTEERIASGDIHPSGPLWGKGELPCRGVIRDLEQTLLASEQLIREGLEREGLKQERRALRLPVRDLETSWPEPTALQLRFTLQTGAYATTVIRELITTT